MCSLALLAIALPTAAGRGAEPQAVAERVAGKRLEIVRGERAIVVRQGQRPLLEYRYGGVSHKPYVARLHSPAGINVLRDAPADHLHHHGLMFAWRVNGVNFWEEAADSGRQEHVRWRELRIAALAPGEAGEDRPAEQAVLREQLHWKSPSGEVLLVEERVLSVPAADDPDACVVTWQSTFRVPDGGREAVVTGPNYNGLGARFIVEMDRGGQFLNEAGQRGVEQTNERPAKWCSYTAQAAAGKTVCVAMFDASDNSRHPARWFTMNQPFAYLAATQGLHREPIRIPAGQQLRLRYGIGVWDGDVGGETLRGAYARWLELPAEARAGTDRGLIGRYYEGPPRGPPRAARVDPCVAFDWSDGTPDERLSGGAFTVRWQGELLVRQDGQYRFYVQTPGRYILSLDGQVAARSGSAAQSLPLEAGFHAIHLEYAADEQPRRVRLCWEADNFPRETISPRYFVHRVDEEQEDEPLLRHERGRELVRRVGCGACHAIAGVEPSAPLGPPLNRAARIGPEYLARWIRDPQSVRPGGGMPSHAALRAVATEPAQAEAAAAIVAYLRSLPLDAATAGELAKKNRYRQAGASNLPSGSRNGGRKLFHELGCAACHAPESPGEALSAATPSLADVGAKWPREELLRYLEDPLLWHPHGRMPDFRLTELEAADLAAYLTEFRALPDGTALPSAEAQRAPADPGDAVRERGRQLVDRLGCAACHALAGQPPRRHAAPPLPGTLDLTAPRGCLHDSQPRLQFGLTGDDRLDIAEFLRQRPAAPSRIAGSETARTLFHSHYECLQCHTRDGQGGDQLSRALLKYLTRAGTSEESAGPEGVRPTAATAMTAPDLSGVGGKLRHSWLESVLQGTAPSPRPWLRMRMPRFSLTAAERTALLSWLTTSDEAPDPPVASPTPGPLPSDASAAAVSLLGPKGFSCTHCHTLGRHQPLTDTPAPDLAMVGQRTDRHWFHRWLEDPARVRPGTAMPSYVRAASGIAGDDLPLQKEILWAYLTTTPADKMVLAAEPARDVTLRGDRPAVVQGRITGAAPLSAVRGVAVGLPGGNSLLFDGGRLAWLGHWRGGFLREVGLHGAHHQWQPSGEPVWLGNDAAPPVVFRHRQSGQWLAPAQWRGRFGWLDCVSQEGRAVRLEYRLRAPAVSPTAQEHLSEAGPWVAVAESIAPNPASTGLDGYTRTVRIRGVPEEFSPIVRLPQTASDGEQRIGEQRIDRWEENATLAAAQHPALAIRRPDSILTLHVAGPANLQWQKVPSQVTEPILEPLTDDPLVPGQRFDPQTQHPRDRVALVLAGGPDQASGEVTIQLLRRPVDGPGQPGRAEPAAHDLGPPRRGDPGQEAPATAEPTYAVDPARVQTLTDTSAVTAPPGFRVERLPLPDDFLACSLAFYRGRLLVGGYDGELRLAEDSDGDTLADRYRHFAGTLDQVNNVRVFDDQVYVAAAGAVYRIEDRDGDQRGETFRLLSSAWDWSGHPFDWFFGLARDRDGNLYGATTTPFERPAEIRGLFRRGSVLRISPQGTTTTVAAGMRYNFGWTSGQTGRVYFTANQGHWNVTCAIHELIEGSHYGYAQPDLAKVKSPIVYTPYPWCRSLTGLVVAAGGSRFGPFQGDGFAADYNTRRIIRWTEQDVGAERQGACYEFVDGLDAGPTDMTFGPDGALYVAFMSDGSWYPERARGGVYRIRYEAPPTFAVRRVETSKDGFRIEFTEPVDPASVNRDSCRGLHRYFHKYQGAYHSEEIAHEDVPLRDVRLSPDGLALTLAIDAHATPRIYRVPLRGVRSRSGRPLHGRVAYVTVKVVPQ